MFSLNHNHMPFAEAGPASPLIVAAGIRDLASREEAVDMALELKRIFSRFGLPFVFKPCFNAASGCWPGGLADLAAIREQADVPVMAAVHDSSQLEAAADAANVIFLSADTAGLPQMLAELGRRDCAVILRKGLYSFSREMADLAATPAMPAYGGWPCAKAARPSATTTLSSTCAPSASCRG